MELAPVPRRRPWSWGARTTLTVLVIAPVFLLVLVPAAFGLERYVMTSHAGDAPRGSVVLARVVPLGDLEEGDVVTFARAGTSGLVSGAVVEAGTAGVAVRVDDDELPIGDRTTVARLVLAVPLVGYPFLGGVYTPALALVALLGGLALCVVFLRDSWRAPAPRRDVGMPAWTPHWAEQG
ncbi:hypothetical protein [Nocardioides sp. AX2bis]|uniref:hypothetical protein n=1 Tax=Nocardioides sp. AX2bis TaxID=2653157 RepID=UPI0012F09B49|nr:hypothetical protein [Nocardioides sp. AX2bis]VXB93262.1 putative Signal peptidase I [Nocardioides sp. AX2bis]